MDLQRLVFGFAIFLASLGACVLPPRPQAPKAAATAPAPATDEEKLANHGRIYNACVAQQLVSEWCNCVASERAFTRATDDEATRTCDRQFYRVTPKSQYELDLDQLRVVEQTDVVPTNAELVYNRDDWKHWIDEDGDCQDTRQEVLIAESRLPVIFKTPKKCKVAKGMWLCPYTNETFFDPAELDVDHLVPLGAADDAGGYAWDSERKQEYANSLRDPAHLVAVSASANRSKGKKGPNEWLPEHGTCDYIKAWIRIKKDWELDIRPAEKRAIVETGCLSEPDLVRKSPTPAPKAAPVASPVVPVRSAPYAPKNCVKGKRCGNSCIAVSKTCHM